MAERIYAVEAAVILGISRDTVCRRAAAGLIPVLAKGKGTTGAYVFDRAVVEHLADEQVKARVEAGLESLRRRPSAIPGMSEVTWMIDPDEDTRIDLVDFLLRELHLPTDETLVTVVACRAVARLSDAVHRRYLAVRGHQPAYHNGYVYRGYTDYLIVQDTYRDEVLAAMAGGGLNEPD